MVNVIDGMSQIIHEDELTSGIIRIDSRKGDWM